MAIFSANLSKHFKKCFAVLITLIISLGCVFFGKADKVSAQQPVDTKANQTVRNIINFLNEVTYSGKAVVGAFDYHTNSDPYANQYYNSIKENFGVSCGIYSAFYPLSSDRNGFSYKEANKNIIKHYNEGAIIMLHNANEWGDVCMGLFPDEDPVIFLRNFDATYEKRNMKVYEKYLEFRKAWADGIAELQEAGVTVIFRPFVEMNNYHFPATYAPTAEGKEHFKRIWRQNYDYMVNERGLHNIVWNFSPATLDDEGLKYYPGDDYVDVVAPTAYFQGATSGATLETMLKYWNYQGFVQLGKPFGLSELGLIKASSGERGDWARLMTGIKNEMPRIAFLSLWTNETGLFSNGDVNAEKFITDSHLLHLEDIPDYQNGAYSSEGVAAVFNAQKYGGNLKVLSLGKHSLSDLRSMGITSDYFKSLKITEGYSVTFYTSTDCSGKGVRVITDTADLSTLTISANTVKSLAVEKANIVNASLKKPVICSDPDSEPNYINDGTLEFWETYRSDPTCWAVIDLQDVYTINRWEVKNVGCYGEMSEANTVNYRFQYSIDGKKWKDADIVFSNTSNITSQAVNQVDAQYVRLYVEKPNSSDFEADKARCAVCEFTVYGAKLSEGRKTDWTLMDLSSKADSSSGKNNDTYNTNNQGTNEISSDTSNVDSSTENTVIENVVDYDTSDSPQDNKEKKDNNYLMIAVIVVGIILSASAIAVLILVIKKKKLSRDSIGSKSV